MREGATQRGIAQVRGDPEEWNQYCRAPALDVRAFWVVGAFLGSAQGVVEWRLRLLGLLIGALQAFWMVSRAF